MIRLDLLNTVASNPDMIARRDVDISLLRASSSITHHTSSWFSICGLLLELCVLYVVILCIKSYCDASVNVRIKIRKCFVNLSSVRVIVELCCYIVLNVRIGKSVCFIGLYAGGGSSDCIISIQNQSNRQCVW